MQKICHGCGKKFECFGTNTCWCHEIEVTKEQLTDLRTSSNDCFCKDCLLQDYKLSSNKR
jgi:hypothetical protein